MAPLKQALPAETNLPASPPDPEQNLAARALSLSLSLFWLAPVVMAKCACDWTGLSVIRMIGGSHSCLQTRFCTVCHVRCSERNL